MHRGVDALHRQIRALDEADLHRRAAVGNTLGRPLLNIDHRVQRVWQVGLQHDAGSQILELRAIEDRFEDRDREVEIVVLLHIEVDELSAVLGRVEQR